jgi:hypothetical protein
MRDAEFRAWSDDAALALTALVRVRSSGILSPKSSGYMHSAYFFPPDPCADHSASFAPVGWPWGLLQEQMVIPAEGVAASDATRVIYGRILLRWGRPDSANLYRSFPALFERLVALATRCTWFIVFFGRVGGFCSSLSPCHILLCRLLLYASIGIIYGIILFQGWQLLLLPAFP